jgi:UrcA family protein
MMKTLPTTRSIRNTIISIAAVSAMALPLFASASVNNNTDSDFFTRSDLAGTTSNEELYAKLQNASRNICGSSRIIATGSLRRSVGNQDCYEGTLTAAVERLDNAEVSALHEQ